MPNDEKKLLIGTGFSLMSGLLYAIYSLLSKWVQQQGASLPQVLFFTFAISWAVIAPYLLRKELHHLATKQIRWHLLRGVFGLLIVFFLGLALQSLPLVDAVMLNNASPLFIPFVAYFILKTPINHRLWPIMGIGLIGLILILKPGKEIFHSGGIWGLMSGLSTAISWVTTRRLTKTEPIGRIVFYFITIGMLLTLFPVWRHWHPLPSSIIWNLLLLGGTYLGSLITLTFATKYLPVTIVGMLYYSVIIFTVILDWLVFHQLPGYLTAIGILLVTGSGIVALRIESK